jgi:hypothetical protein
VCKLFSRLALVVTLCYAALIAVLLAAAWHFVEPEGIAWAALFIGFPWALATLPFQHGGLWLYFSAVILNVATVYVFVLALVKIFSSQESSSRPEI